VPVILANVDDRGASGEQLTGACAGSHRPVKCHERVGGEVPELSTRTEGGKPYGPLGESARHRCNVGLPSFPVVAR
jgi:hypothetical protein